MTSSVAADDAVAGRLSTGIDSPVTIDSSTAALAVDHDAIDRDFLARAHAQRVADLHDVERHVFLAAVPHDARRLRRQPEQLPDRARRCDAARAAPAPGRGARAR